MAVRIAMYNARGRFASLSDSLTVGGQHRSLCHPLRYMGCRRSAVGSKAMLSFPACRGGSAWAGPRSLSVAAKHGDRLPVTRYALPVAGKSGTARQHPGRPATNPGHSPALRALMGARRWLFASLCTMQEDGSQVCAIRVPLAWRSASIPIPPTRHYRESPCASGDNAAAVRSSTNLWPCGLWFLLQPRRRQDDDAPGTAPAAAAALPAPRDIT